MNNVIVIGAGASGLVAAINAARCGANVTIIEKNNKAGKKLLATGNGRCNMTNMDLSASKYRGEDIAFVERLISKYKTEDIISFFESIALKTKDLNGYVYPYSLQSSTVVDKLYNECIRLGVKVRMDTECVGVKFKDNNSILVETKGKNYEVDSLIVASGLVANVGIKGDTVDEKNVFALKLAKNMGHNVYGLTTGLTGLKCKNPYLSKVSGVRWESKVATFVDGVKVFEDRGELQFADYGISGIVVFQNARFASKSLKNNKKTEVFVDFMPELCQIEVKNMLEDLFNRFKNMSVFDVLTGIFNSKIVTYILLNAGIDENIKAKDFENYNTLVDTIKNHKMQVCGTRGFEFAQVCAGGIDTREINDTMESKMKKNVYFVGEALDVDGMCGGYNLHFAFASGLEAGINAGKGFKQ